MSNDLRRLSNTYNKSSRYYQTPVLVDDFVRDGTARLGLWKAPDLRPYPELDLTEDMYTTYMLAESDLYRADLLAYKFYNDVNLWWALCLFNGILNPLTDMEIGQIIKIPNKELLLEAMSKKSGSA